MCMCSLRMFARLAVWIVCFLEDAGTLSVIKQVLAHLACVCFCMAAAV